MGWRVDLILRAERLECGVYGALTIEPAFMRFDVRNIRYSSRVGR
ncbi:hypothetical protein A6A12_2601 [Vibrio anguillarum]|nr:hypothetical protein A6A12_2601 [Vibrio anguillarum]